MRVGPAVRIPFAPAASQERTVAGEAPGLQRRGVSGKNLFLLTYIADADYDAVIIEMEHEGFSFTTLRASLQVLLNRKRIADLNYLHGRVTEVDLDDIWKQNRPRPAPRGRREAKPYPDRPHAEAYRLPL